MKFDPYAWREVKANEETEQPKGRLQLRLSQAAPLYITAQGVEALAGVSTEFDVTLSEAVTFRVDGPKALRVFLLDPVCCPAWNKDPASGVIEVKIKLLQ